MAGRRRLVKRLDDAVSGYRVECGRFAEFLSLLLSFVDGHPVRIRRARRHIERLLDASPGLRHELGRMIDDKTIAAQALVLSSLAGYDEQPLIGIAATTYSEEQVLGERMPERR